jgi:hypothetical protein
MEPDKIANWLLIELTRELIDAGFMHNELAPAGLACADEFGFYTCREEPNGSVTLIGQDDTAMHYLGLARNAATASCTVG